MKFVPHDYQQHAIHYILNHKQAAIFLGMGLGKTIITLTALQHLILNTFEVRKTLIIAPKRVARDTWPTELKKWDHLHNLRMAVMVGTKKQRQTALHADADIWTINRENLKWLVDELEGDWPFDMVVIDELSNFKGTKTQCALLLRKQLPHINRIIGLTGTPAPNGLIDLWGQFRVLDGGKRLGTHITHFRNRYCEPDKRNGHIIYSWKLKPGADTAIYNAIADMTISMETTDYLTLPPLTIRDYPVAMEPAQLKTYLTMKRDLVLTLDEDTITSDTAGALAGKLQQLASGAIYASDDKNTWHEIHCAKLDALEDIIESANGQPVLVCFWFKHELPRIQQRIPEAKHLNTAEDFQAWNRGDTPVALIHPASAGHGLNLQDGGHYMVWYTLPWSLELYEQANARLFRQGQQHPVTITRITCADTIDAQVVRALESKNITQTALIEAVKTQLRKDTPS